MKFKYHTLAAKLSAEAAWSVLDTDILVLEVSLDASGKLGVELDILVIMLEKVALGLLLNLAIKIIKNKIQ